MEKELYKEVQDLMNQLKEAEFIYSLEPTNSNKRKYFESWILLYDSHQILKLLELDEFLEGFNHYIENKNE